MIQPDADHRTLDLCSEDMALDGNEAAEMLVACFPSVMMRKGCSFKVALATLMGQCAPPEPTATKIATNETRFARALQNACADRQTFGIYRVLDRHNTPVADNDAETVRAVAAQLFTRNLEHETPDEEIAYAAHRGLREECQHDAAVPIRAADVRAWAFKKSRRAADINGWCGRLILDFIAVRPEVSQLLAKFISRAPRAMHSDSAASTHCGAKRKVPSSRRLARLARIDQLQSDRLHAAFGPRKQHDVCGRLHRGTARSADSSDYRAQELR